MKRFLLVVFFGLYSWAVQAQSFEVTQPKSTYTGRIGETVYAPIRIKNTSNKTITLVLRKAEAQIGSTQKSFFCPDGSCLEIPGDSFTLKLEPGQTLDNFSIALETGLSEGSSDISYELYNKANASDIAQLDLHFVVEGKPDKGSLYQSADIIVHDIFPNPAASSAILNYALYNNGLKAKIVIHNILGTALFAYDLPATQNSIKIDVDDLSAGIYIYTLYLNNEGVVTRKLMVKK